MKQILSSLVMGCLLACSAASIQGCGFFKQAAQQKAEKKDTPLFETTPISYDATVSVEDGGADSSLATEMKKHSQLILLREQLPDGLAGLRRRASADRDAALKLMRSLGYYDGTAEAGVAPAENEGGKAKVVLTLRPGDRYRIDDIRFRYTPQPVPFPASSHQPPPPVPDKLAGIAPGDEARAVPILDAVSAVPPKLHVAGYPEAEVAGTRYTLNKKLRTLQADVRVNPGPAATMGGVEVSGAKDVDPEYIRRLVTWERGDFWDSRKLESFRQELQKTGLFRSVDVKPAKAPGNAAQPVELAADVEVQEASFKTIAAGAKYNSDDGFGIQGEWTHRNLFGAGEKLSIKVPFTQDKQGFQADFEKPCFGSRDRKFLAGASEIKEQTDAYDTTATNAYIGLEQRLSRNWWTSGKLFAEAGTVTKSEKDTYRYESVILSLRRDTRNDLLNPTSGTQLQWDLAPTQGYYRGNFSGASVKMTAAGYYAPLDSDRLVLAGRMMLGSFAGVDIANIPPSLRFYSGGGGSVRGYSYQGIGKKDKYGDPAGGRSSQEISLEARFKITDTLGIVPFLDGGMIYDEEMPKLFQDLQWAAGLGFRYYTSIGPVRLDIAVPLDKKKGDDAYQFYISIGQAF